MLLLFVACVGKGLGPDDEALGTLTSPEAEVAVVGTTAYGFNLDGAIAIYVAGGTPSCETVAGALAGQEYNPDDLTPPGTCSAFLYADYDGTEATWTSSPATFALNCAFGDGTWEISDACDDGYCYSGHFWTGSPSTWSVTASGGDEADYAVTLSLEGGDGQYPYESLDTVTLSGAASGQLTAAWCSDFGESVYF